MSTPLIVYILTALAGVVVVLTRLRLARPGVAGRAVVSPVLKWFHFGCGMVALVAWVAFLVGEDFLSEGAQSLIGISAVGLWWVTSLAGLLILMRWLPTRGRHSSPDTGDGWSDGPGLSVLAHVGLVVGVAVFTWAYLTSAV